MSTGEIAFLALAVGAITLFGGALAWASWMESRDAKIKVPESGPLRQPRLRAPAF
jgi:hypothetical protein